MNQSIVQIVERINIVGSIVATPNVDENNLQKANSLLGWLLEEFSKDTKQTVQELNSRLIKPSIMDVYNEEGY